MCFFGVVWVFVLGSFQGCPGFFRRSGVERCLVGSSFECS